jgi:hypothetical protein
MRRRILLLPAVVLGFFAVLPPVGAEEAGGAGDVAGGSGGGGVPGFTTVATHAQGQAATGYFFNVGNEENRLVGALSEIATPPSSSQNIAALVQRGVAASFIYGMAGGGGPGKAGVLPQPPPGEADAFYPAEPAESKYEGPVTAGAKGPVVDGRFYAKASDTPTGRADSAVSNLEVPGQLKISQAVVSSHTEPAEGGIAAESVSVLYGITLGPLQIETMVSRAYGFVPAAPGEPKGVATTVIDGATVNGTPVKITEKGVVVGDQAVPGAQDQVNAALAEAGYSDVRLAPSSATPGESNESVNAVTGTLRVVHRDDKMAQQFQGFAGGGFAVGGAEVRVVGDRCADCPSGTGSIGEVTPSLPVGGEPTATSAEPPASSASTADATAAGNTAGSGSTAAGGTAAGSLSAGSSAAGSYLSGSGSASSTSTTAVTPPSADPSLGGRTGTGGASMPAAAAAVSPSAASLALAAASELNPKVAHGLPDGVLVGAMALLGAVLLGARLITRTQ